MKLHMTMILAATPEGHIGYKNTIPWRLSGDLKRFKELTMGKVVVMGRSTFESLPGGLEGRIPVVVSESFFKDRPRLPTSYQKVWWVPDIPTAIQFAKDVLVIEMVFMGGKRIYEEALPLVDRIELTLVHKGQGQDYDTTVESVIDEVRKPIWVLENLEPIMDRSADSLPTPSHTYLTYVKDQKLVDLLARQPVYVEPVEGKEV